MFSSAFYIRKQRSTHMFHHQQEILHANTNKLQDKDLY